MTVTKISSKKRSMCPYCGMVPADQHPDFTCPRLAGITMTDDGYSVDFIEPEKWEAIKRGISDVSAD